MRGPLPPAGDPRFRAAFDELYRLFEAPRPRVIEGCACCLYKKDVDVLLITPLREVGGQPLWSYTFSAFLTVGGERDFRYLLPRILELAVCEPDTMPDPEIVLDRLRRAGWESWDRRERRAIETLLDLWFDLDLERDLLQAEEDGWLYTCGCESVLCGIARAGLDIAPWLGRIAEPRCEPIRAHLTASHAKAISREKPTNYWEDAPEGWAKLVALLRS